LPLQRLTLLLCLILCTSVNLAFAAYDWGMCRSPSFTVIENTHADNVTEVEADLMTRGADEIVYFNGQVELTRSDQSLLADKLTLDNSTAQASASGNVTFTSPIYQLQTEFMTINQNDQSGFFLSPSFTLPDRHIRGTASEIVKFDDSLSRYQNILYTSCDPGDSDWHMTAGQLDINRETGRGTAQHATIYIQDVPILYLPYIMFPVDDRRMSGLLTPTIGFSDSNGGSLSAPVYWNIAPNLDATITPAWYGDRGVQLNTENRYLFNNHNGQIDLSYLDDDKANDSRWFQKWTHQANFGSSIDADIVWRDVSDATFFDDFELLGDTTDDVDHLERHVTVNHDASAWQTSLLLQDYKTADSSFRIASRPYRRLPRLTVDSRFRAFDNGFQLNSQNEWVRFDHESDAKVTGRRTHLLPYLSWEQSASWFFFKPKLEYALTDYQLDNNNSGANSIQRDIPVFSLDTGLIFDRDMSSGENWTQTLEPRLYFLRTPFEDQSNIPVFDSAVLSESYENFFKSNRFSGNDRIGDANQVALGIGSRVFDNDSGAELLYARIGQVFYADDRRVSLGGSTETSNKSNIIAQTTINPTTSLSIKNKLVYEPITKEFTQRELSINYHHSRFVANLEYFFNDTILEQAALSAVYPINERWTLLAKYHESILFDKPVENLFGLNYESCCWGIKILASQTSNDTFTETDNAVFFELTLKGLGQAGQALDSRLQSAIPGYQPNF
jgi:LPS-assembly protein